jgi:hypothetical protein
VMPVLVGTALVIMLNQPTPMGSSFVSARAAEASLWLFAAFGALLTRQRQTRDSTALRFHWIDGAAALAVVLAVKVMARGILITP